MYIFTEQIKRYVPTLAIILLSFSMYYIGLAPSVVAIFDDSLEFPLVVHHLAIAHPTGYPFYILLGKLFSIFQPTNVAYQLNLMSAIFASLTVGVMYHVGLTLSLKLHVSDSVGKGVTKSYFVNGGAILGAFLFGTGAIFYSQATIAEVYTLNSFFVILILFFTLQKRWLALAFTLGLSLTHHRTIVLLIPAILISSLIAERQNFFKNVFKLQHVLAGAVPLLLYLYLPLRGHVGSLDGNYEHSISGFWTHITAADYSAFLFSNPFGNERNIEFYQTLFVSELYVWGIVLAVFGIGCLIIDRRWHALSLTGIAFLTYFVFNISYTVSDIEVFFLPNFLIIALWAGIGMNKILVNFCRYCCRTTQFVHASWLNIILVIIALFFLVGYHRGTSRANDWHVHNYGMDVLQHVESDAAIVGILGEITLFRYMQAMYNVREDVDVPMNLQTYVADLEVERFAVVEDLLKRHPHKPIYITRELAGLADRYSLSAVGPLIQVHAEPISSSMQKLKMLHSLSTSFLETDISLTPEINLAGYEISYPYPNHVRLTILWHITKTITTDLKISARLLDDMGEIVAVIDKIPVHFAYPTRKWRADEFICDVYDLELVNPSRHANKLTILLVMYEPADGAKEVGRAELSFPRSN